MRSIAMSAIAALALSAGGCGLISSDVTDFDLTLPDKTFTVDTSQWMLDSTDVGTVTSVKCAADPSGCEAALQASKACKADQCTASCSGSDAAATCQLAVLVSLYQMVNLVMEKPELQTINDQPLVGVQIDKLEYQVTENTLNVPTPPMVLYVAPSTVMAPGDPMSHVIGTIPAIPAGQTQALMAVDLSVDGQAELAKYMGDYKTPFNIIVGSTLDVKMGDAVPSGRLTAKVKVTAHAHLGG